jgi:hypothetical protein
MPFVNVIIVDVAFSKNAFDCDDSGVEWPMLGSFEHLAPFKKAVLQSRQEHFLNRVNETGPEHRG